MFDNFKDSVLDAFSTTTVVERANTIEIEGIRAHTFINAIDVMWRSSKIAANMFSRATSRKLAFPSFFAVEVLYIFERILGERKNRIPRKQLIDVITKLKTNTWLKSLHEPESGTSLNRSALKRFNLSPLDHQHEFADEYEKAVARYRLNGYLLAAAPGSGKAQPLHSLIKTPAGWSTMGEMKIGTEVMTPAGTVTKVNGVFPQGAKDIFRVVFADGRVVECCDEHLWKVHSRHESKKGDYWKVKSLREIIESTSFRDQRVYVPLIETQDTPDIPLPMHPYLLGVILGDGSISNTSISITKEDPFIREKIATLLPDGVMVRPIKDSITFNISNTAIGPYKNPVKETLREMGLMGTVSDTKFVPKEYLEGSRKQRLELLNGLLDTDGYFGKGSNVSFCSTSFDLAQSVQYLVRSLGGIASISILSKSYTYLGEKKAGKIAYQVNIRYKKPSDLFTLPRKKERANDEHQYAEHLKLRIDRIEHVGLMQAQCISVEDPEHLYVTNDFVVTHNTLMYLYLSEMLDTDVTFIFCPKNAVDRVFRATFVERFVKTPDVWYSDSDTPPKKGMRYYVCHYEYLEKMADFIKANGYDKKKVNICLDECHNFNDLKSARTERFCELVKWLNPLSVLWGSGTPIKAMGSEAIPLLRTITRDFTPNVEHRFKSIFGLSSARGLDILANRIGKVSFRIDKQATVGNQVDKYRIDLSIPNGDRFTLNNIRILMSNYVKERQEYYAKNERKYLDQYHAGIVAFETTLNNPAQQKELALYKSYAREIRRGYDPVIHKEISAWCNRYEKRNILPTLPQPLRNEFKSARSVYKYVSLKIVGEALGRILGKERTACNVAMLQAINSYRVTELFDDNDKYDSSLLEIIATSDSKSLIFTSYVEVVTALNDILKKSKLQPLMVYGETNKDLPAIMRVFDTDTKADPLIATFMSLSTAVPVISASTVVFLNAPFRAHEYEQALSRVDRIGQKHVVRAYDVYLDTGKEPNISTRSVDIMEWSKSQVEAIMGVKSADVAALEDIKEDTTGEYGDILEPTDHFETEQAPALEHNAPSWSTW